MHIDVGPMMVKKNRNKLKSRPIIIKIRVIVCVFQEAHFVQKISHDFSKVCN